MEVLCLKLKMINYISKHVYNRTENDKMNEIKEYIEKLFEDIKHIDDEGNN